MGKKQKKSNSKNKAKAQSSKQTLKETSTDNIHCSMCYDIVKNKNKNLLLCSTCQKPFHSHCYSPAFQGKKFNCDQCLLPPQKKLAKLCCIVCNDGNQSGPLKITGQYVFHIDCIIFSPNYQFQSFITLKIAGNKKNPFKNSNDLCQICKKKEPNTLMRCQLCKYTAHYKCIWLIKQTDVEVSFITNWLDKCEKQNYLLDFIIKKRSHLKDLIRQIPEKIARDKILICENHENPKNFTWCPCNRPEINSNDYKNWIMCDECDRYNHIACTNLQKGDSGSYLCRGCRTPEKNLFIREMKIYETLQQIAKIQKQNTLTQKNIRFLNAFPFNYSNIIQKKINDHLQQIQNYFAKKQIDLYLRSKDDQMEAQLTQQQQEKVQLLVLFILHREKKQVNKKKLASPQEVSKILENIQTDKNFSAIEHEIILKIREIFKRLLSSLIVNNKFTLLKEKLNKLILVCSSNNANRSSSNLQEISELLFEISQIMQKIKNDKLDKNNSDEFDNSKFIKAFEQKFKNTLMWALLDAKKTKEQMKQFVEKYGAIKYLLLKKKDLHEEEYWKFTQKYFNNKQQINASQMQDEKIQHNRSLILLKHNLSKVKVKSSAVAKQQMVYELKKKLQDKKYDYHLVQQDEENAIVNQIATFGSDYPFEYLNCVKQQASINKKLFLMICHKKEQDITQADFIFMPKLDEFLSRQKSKLSAKQFNDLHIFKIKLNFMVQLLKKGEPLLQVIVPEYSDENQGDIEQNRNNSEQSKIIDKLISILERWNDTVLPLLFMIPQILIITKANIHFDSPELEQALSNACIKLGQFIEKFTKQGRKIRGSTLRDFATILRFYGKQIMFSELMRQYTAYQQWINIIIPSQPISIILEKPEKTQNLIKIIDHRLSQAGNIQVDITHQIHKMHLIKMWCLISDKKFSSKKKPTYNAIHNLKIYGQKLSYPKNAVWDSIMSLLVEGVALNKQISKFLQKPKLSSFTPLHDQLKMMSQKMNHSEGLSMKRQLEQSNLDNSAQIQELQQELKDFEDIPKNFSNSISTQNIKQLKKLRTRCIDSCFRPNDLNQYHKLAMKILELRCINFEPPVQRLQYFELINLGGVPALELVAKTSKLYSAYRSIQTAEKELISNTNIHKRNFNNLIEWDERKIRELKEQLKIDTKELNHIEKARQHSNQLRETFARYRNMNIQYQKLVQLDNQLHMTLFNHKDIIQQIRALKNDYQELVMKIQSSFNYNKPEVVSNAPNQNLMLLQRHYLEKYHKLKIRNSSLQAFERDCKIYKDIRQISGVLLDKNTTNNMPYHKFNLLCVSLHPKFAKHRQIMDLREKLFFLIHKRTISSEAPLFDIWHTLIDQGLQLKKLGSPYKEKIFSTVFELYVKIEEAMNSRLEQMEENEDQNIIDSEISNGVDRGIHMREDMDNLDEQSESDSNQQQQDDDPFGFYEDEDSQSQLDEDDDSPEDEIKKNGQGRKLQHNEIVLDDDD